MTPSDTSKLAAQNQAVMATNHSIDGALPLQAIQSTQPGAAQGMGEKFLTHEYQHQESANIHTN